MATPPITIVTSTYNYPAALELAIKTALEQSFGDFEYLVIGDACTDETEELVRSFKDKRIRWSNLKNNKGNQSDVNRIALKRARGDWIAYLNHDDLWYPEHLETLYACVTDGGFDMAASLALAISPPPQFHRQIVGLPAQPRGSDALTFISMTSTVLHSKAVAEAAGGWAQWRKFDGVPTLDFFERLRNQTHNHAVVPRITCLKFHSADRRNSYRLKDASEQRSWYQRMKDDPDLRHREMATAMALRYAKVPIPRLQQPDKPIDARPGWQIEQYRRLRGLEPMLDLGPGEEPAEQGLSPPNQDGPIRRTDDGRIWVTEPGFKKG